MLILSRIYTENKIAEKKEANFSSLINGIAGDFAQLAKNKNIGLKLEIEDGCFFNANELHMEIMFNSLFDNAIKYSPADGDVLITLNWREKKFHFCIENKGEAVLENDQKRIFDRFYRANDGQNGSGLGLSIVKRILELHGVKIKFTSKNGVNSFNILFNPA